MTPICEQCAHYGIVCYDFFISTPPPLMYAKMLPVILKRSMLQLLFLIVSFPCQNLLQNKLQIKRIHSHPCKFRAGGSSWRQTLKLFPLTISLTELGRKPMTGVLNGTWTRMQLNAIAKSMRRLASVAERKTCLNCYSKYLLCQNTVRADDPANRVTYCLT